MIIFFAIVVKYQQYLYLTTRGPCFLSLSHSRNTISNHKLVCLCSTQLCYALCMCERVNPRSAMPSECWCLTLQQWPTYPSNLAQVCLFLLFHHSLSILSSSSSPLSLSLTGWMRRGESAHRTEMRTPYCWCTHFCSNSPQFCVLRCVCMHNYLCLCFACIPLHTCSR